MRSERTARFLVAASLVAALAAGCERARVEDSAIDRFPRASQELDFLDALLGQVVVTRSMG